MVEIRGNDLQQTDCTTTSARDDDDHIHEDHHDHNDQDHVVDDQMQMQCVDWRGRPCNPHYHGGMKAAIFVLGVQALEMMAIAGVGNNLITYVFNEMHFPLSTSANIVTNFVGTVFLLSLLGGFLSDSYLGSFSTIFFFGFFELAGFILLAVQAHVDDLRPAPCNMVVGTSGDHQHQAESCEQAKGYKAVMFFAALYLVALGSGCLKPNIISHGADQFRPNPRRHRHLLSSYFNAAYFAFCTGQLVAVTLLVWLQTYSGMDVGFGVSAAAMAVGLLCLLSGTSLYCCSPPRGSIFTPIAQVFVAAYTKRKQICTSKVQNPQFATSTTSSNVTTTKFRFLDKACMKVEEGRRSGGGGRECSEGEVEQVKKIVSVIPILGCTIIWNTILAQLQTFSVQQGSLMNTHIHMNMSHRRHSFSIPPASLQAIPYILLIFLVPLYELAFVPAARKLTRRPSGISPLQRVGIGLFLSTFSMVCAALVEAKRRRHDPVGINISKEKMSILWIAPQFLIFGVSEMFTAVGLIEFFYMQSLEGTMQSFMTAMTYCSYSFGFYLSSVLVSVVNKVTSHNDSSRRSRGSDGGGGGGGGGGGWLGHNDLNQDRLDLFYWLLAALSLLNFLNYIFWSRRYYSNNI